MSRHWKRPGPLGSGIFTLPHADLRFRSAFDAEFSLPRSHLLRVAAPESITVFLRASPLDDLGPEFERLPDDQAEEICAQIDEEEENQGFHTRHPFVRHVYLHLAIGPQVVFHQPFRHADPRDPLNSFEADATVAIDINVVMRDDDEKGFEFTATLQGSANWFILDPNRGNPDITDPNELARGTHAQQGQLQLQAAYFFKSIDFLGTKLSFSILAQAAGAATYQYDPTKRHAGLTYSAAGALGAGLDIELNDRTSLGIQITGGASSGGTADFAASAVIKGQFELGPKIKPRPKKKKPPQGE